MKERIQLYDNIINNCKGFERKGKNMLYTSSNGYMFSLLNKAGEIGVRLSKEDTKVFGEKYKIQPYISYGAKMREYVLLSEEALQNDFDYVVNLFEKGFKYVNSLPSK